MTTPKEAKDEAVAALGNAHNAIAQAKAAILCTSPIAFSSVEVRELDRADKKVLLVMQNVNSWKII